MKITYAVVMVITGMIIPVMASLNTALSLHLKSVSSAVVLFFLVAFVCASAIALAEHGTQALQIFSAVRHLPLRYLLGGIGVVIYITSVSVVGPKLGIGNSLACVLLGQLLTMTVVDHYALFGMPKSALSTERAFGLLLMISGILLVLTQPVEK